MLWLVLGGAVSVVVARLAPSGLASFSLPRLQAGMPSCESACYTEPCAHCNDRCFDSKEGDCAECWVAKDGFACLTSNSSLSDCRSCWAFSPCQICRAGSCARCEACQQSKEGDCASCWVPDSQNYTCILGYEGRDCKGCWNTNMNSMPIVITSGLTASTLTATWKGIPLCKDSPTPTVIWPWPDDMTPTDLVCYVRLLKVTFDPSTNTFHNLPGVNVSVVNFGGLNGLSFSMWLGAYEQFGYKEGVNMFGAPFDWRLSAQGSQQLYTDLQTLIERVANTTKKRVALLAPSYGPQMMLGFLQLMTQQWKDTYLEWFVASSPVWSGSSTALYSMAAGLSLAPNSSGVIDRAFRDVEVHLPSLMWLCPEPGTDNYTYPSNLPLILTSTKNYSAFDLAKVLADVGYSDAIAQAQYLQRSGPLYKFEAPLVNTWINYGYQLDTLTTVTMEAPLSPSRMPKVINATLSSGDGVVTVRSSLRGMLWTDAHKKANKILIHSGYANLQHAACLLPLADPNHTACFYSMIDLLVNGTLPKPAAQ